MGRSFMRHKTVRIAALFLFCTLALLASGGCGGRGAVLTEIERLDETRPMSSLWRSSMRPGLAVTFMHIGEKTEN